MRLILGLDALRPPLTGIGHYTRQLAVELFASNQLEGIEGLLGGKKMATAQLRDMLAQDVLPPDDTLSKLKGQLTRQLRAVPGAYALRKSIHHLRCKLHNETRAHVIYHEPNALACGMNLPTVVTLHDLSHLRYPETHPRERVAYMQRELPGSLQRAQHIIVDAHATKQEAIATFALPEDKLSVIPLGVDTPFFDASQTSPHTLARWNLQARQYLLSVGTLEPRKNIERTLLAYDALPDPLRKAFPLVLVGGKGWKDEAILARTRQIRPPGKVILTGYVAQSTLIDLYAHAAAFVYPSLYEGFGLPILEAMAAGVPVITSNTSAMPEVAGDAALLIDPLDVDALGAAMQRILQDSALAATLSRRGHERAKQYTWARTAALTLDVYRRVLG